jgi:CRISPR-associated protein Csh2
MHHYHPHLIADMRQAAKNLPVKPYYDSASKAGTDIELLIWIPLKENSKLGLPNFSQLILMKEEKENGKVVLDLLRLKTILTKHLSEIETVEIYRNDASIKIENLPENASVFDL